MITKLSITDFQCHKQLVLNLDQVNTIVGSTDVGKSAILRALKWISLNSPRGSAFIREGADGTKVQVVVDGKIISRRKGNNRNHYSINGDVYEALGVDVPAEVREVLNLGPDNFQNQHDPHFCISLSPPEVSRRLNDVVDLSVIDTTLGNIATELRRTTVEIGVVEKRVEAAKDTHDKINYAKQLDKELQVVEGLKTKRAQLESKVYSLNPLVREAGTTTNHTNAGRESVRCGLSVVDIGIDIEKTHGRIKNLENIIESITEAQRVAATKEDVADLTALVSTLDRHAQRVSGLQRLLAEAEGLSEMFVTIDKELKKDNKALREAMGSVCALCERPL